MEAFSQIIPGEICLSCDICCRFIGLKSPWRPKVSGDEYKNFDIEDVEENYLRAVDNGSICKCKFFNEENNACKVYLKRPLECKIYPFVIVKKDDKEFVCLHKVCPFVKEKRDIEKFKEWIEEVKAFFSRKDVVALIKCNQHLAGDYSDFNDEIEEILELDLKNE